VNVNKARAVCYKQVAAVEKLEFRPNFEYKKKLQMRYRREFRIAEKTDYMLLAD
jgi:hypothetical protein